MRRTFNDTTIGDTLVAEGYGVVVRASRGELEWSDGIGRNRPLQALPDPRPCPGDSADSWSSVTDPDHGLGPRCWPLLSGRGPNLTRRPRCWSAQEEALDRASKSCVLADARGAFGTGPSPGRYGRLRRRQGCGLR
jgi:hypothetical protein